MFLCVCAYIPQNDQACEIRIEIDEAQTAYTTRIGKRNRNWSIRCTNDQPETFGTMLYCWEKDVTFQKLSSAAVQRSVKSADIVTLLSNTELHLALEWKIDKAEKEVQ